MSVLTATVFDLDEETAEAATNLATLDILTIAYREAGWGESGDDGVPINE